MTVAVCFTEKPMTSITIQGYKFEVPPHTIDPYVVGYTLSEEGEAHALKQTKMENLRNNFAPRIKVALNGAETLTDDQVKGLQSDFDKYAEEYKFGVRSGVTRTRLDPLTREMLSLAKADFKRAYEAKFDEKPDTELVNERAEELIDKRRDDYMKRARAIIRQREASDVGTLEELGL
jgi:hypothetical protein